jgi:hypothetical protein
VVDGVGNQNEFPLSGPRVRGNHRTNLQPTRTFELVRMDLNAATAGTARWLLPDASACGERLLMER